MKKNILILVGILGLTVGLVAYDNSRAAAQTQPAAPPRGSTFEQRLAQRKNERKIVLEQRDISRLGGTCVNSQGKIRGLQQKTTTVLDNRSKVYLRVDAKLLVIIGRLRLADQNTFPLEKLRARYSTDVGRFQALSTYYKQVLDDMTLINCQEDVVGFKALLDTTRIYHKQLRSQSTLLHDSVVNDIKNNLSDHAKVLQPAPAVESEGGQ